METIDGRLITVEEHLNKGDLQLKKYDYCTDEHVDVNPNCNRFDEGTNLTEIAEHWVKAYEENYARRNLRNGLKDFSTYDDPSYLSRINLIFRSLRVNFERYESIKNKFNLAEDSPFWEKVDFLKDLKQAVITTKNFFLSVLETPDTMCAIANKSNPNEIIGLIPLRNESPMLFNCYDPDLADLKEIMIVGQAGKSFKSLKDSAHNNDPSADQIDVRGIWLDKMLAIKSLMARKTGILFFDDFTSNYMDVSAFQAEISERIGAILLDEAHTLTTIKTVSGENLEVNTTVSMYHDQEANNSHMIMIPLHPGLRQQFNIFEPVEFQNKLIEVVKSYLPSESQKSDVHSLLNSISTVSDNKNSKDFSSVIIGPRTVYVHKDALIANKALMYLEMVNTLDTIPKDRLTVILNLIKGKKKIAKKSPENEKYAYFIAGKEGIERYLNGGFHRPSFYRKLLSSMSN